MSEESKTNVERLIEAGVIKAENLSDEHRDVINGMSADEVEAILGATKKLGDAGFSFEDQGGF